jgi:probable F420-dependent oxidoreductase
VESYGFDSLWVSDHVVVPRNLTSRYPYSPDGSFPVPPDIPFLEPLATLLFVAAITERVQLGTTVLVLPMRNPIVTAKTLATLDVLSNGRLILGVGAGWMREEFELLDVPFERRGVRLDEYLQTVKALWTEEHPSFQGRFSHVENVGFAPKPVQQPHPPIWIGGHSAPALKRVAQFGDAWHAAYVGPELLHKQFNEVREHAERLGRDPNSVQLTVRTRLPLGDPPRAIEQLSACQELGVSHLVTEAFPADLDKARRLLEVLATEVRPKASA